MHIAIHIPAHRRTTITRIAYTALERTRSEFHALGYTTSVCVGGSGRQDRELAHEFGYDFQLIPNQPLGQKFDLLAKHIHRTTDYDWFMEYCTDNVLAEGYAERAHKEMTKPSTQQVGVRSFYIVSLEDTRINVFTGGYSNVGRLTRRDVITQTLERHNELYTRRLNSRMDKSFFKLTSRAAKFQPVHIDDGIWLLDIKGNLNINSRDGYPESALSLSKSFPEFTQAHPTWRQPQAKSGQTASASTSATPPAPSATTSTAHGATSQQPKTTAGSSSPAPPRAPSAGRSKSSTRRRKTTTGKGKSSRAGSSGA